MMMSCPLSVEDWAKCAGRDDRQELTGSLNGRLDVKSGFGVSLRTSNPMSIHRLTHETPNERCTALIAGVCTEFSGKASSDEEHEGMTR